MKTRMTKIISCFLVLVMLVGIIPFGAITAFAVEEIQVKDHLANQIGNGYNALPDISTGSLKDSLSLNSGYNNWLKDEAVVYTMNNSNSLQKPFYFVQRGHWQYKQRTNQVLWLLFQSLNCIEPQILICPQIVTYMMILLLFLLFITSTRFLGDIDNGFSVHFPNTQGVTNRGCVISVC